MVPMNDHIFVNTLKAINFLVSQIRNDGVTAC